MRLKNKNILVYGLGLSGKETIKFLLSKKAKVFFYDDDKQVFNNFKCENTNAFVVQQHISKIDMVVVSPGVHGSHIIKLFEIARVPIINEIELASLFIKKGKIIAITGTNGKTTTTRMLESILNAGGKKNFACGNVGVPFICFVNQDSHNTYYIVEVSSFQLERTNKFCPDISVVLNISKDHLNRHKSFEGYKKLKISIAKKQKKKHVCILNSNLKTDACQFEQIAASKVWFGDQWSSAYVKNDEVVIFGKKLCTAKQIGLAKGEISDNQLAAILAASYCGVGESLVISALKNFLPEAHRLEFVKQIEGVSYINDSKATNPASTVYAIKKLNKKNIVLLLGGQDKQFEFEGIFKLKSKLKHVVCFGQAQSKIFDAGKNMGFLNMEKAASFTQAFNLAKAASKKGDTVLLSPACASFDEFLNYKDRGEVFKRLVYGEEKSKQT